jgi:hypothetical protein
VKTPAKVIKVKGNKLAVQFESGNFKEGDLITLHKGSTRTTSQNNFYWKYLTWMIEFGGLQELGHFSVEALHDNLKAHFKIATTTDMGKTEFGEYMDKVNGLMIDLGTNPAEFWEQYQEEYGKYK